MRIGFVIPSFLSGGAERVMSILCNEFAQKGHEITLYLTEDAEHIFYPLDPRIRIVGITVNKKNYAARVPSYIKKLSRDLKEQGTDIVISFITRTNIISICACKRIGVPVIISERNNPYMVPASKLWRVIRDFVYRYSDGAVFQTRNARDYFCTKVVAKSVVIKNPMSEAVSINYDYNIKENRIVSICRLDPQKNLSLLIHAFNKIHTRIPDYTLHIYGDGTQKEMLSNLITVLNLKESVFLDGKTENVVEVLKKAKIFVLSSNFEGLSNSVMEAMCVGTACVVTDSPSYGNRELISRGYNGFLVPCNDVDAMAEQILCLANDDALIKIVAGNSRKLYESTNSKAVIKEWENYIQRVLKK